MWKETEIRIFETVERTEEMWNRNRNFEFKKQKKCEK